MASASARRNSVHILKARDQAQKPFPKSTVNTVIAVTIILGVVFIAFALFVIYWMYMRSIDRRERSERERRDRLKPLEMCRKPRNPPLRDLQKPRIDIHRGGNLGTGRLPGGSRWSRGTCEPLEKDMLYLRSLRIRVAQKVLNPDFFLPRNILFFNFEYQLGK